jgi:hypothetical protein
MTVQNRPATSFDPSRVRTSNIETTFNGPRNLADQIASFFDFGRVRVPQEIVDVRVQQATTQGPTRHYDGREIDKGWTGLNFVQKGATERVLDHHKGVRDAGRTHVASDNADLFVLRYAYSSHKSMEAWVQNPPKDGKLSLNVVITPSWHAGSNDAEKQKNGEKFGRENIYNVEVRTKSGELVTSMKFDVEGNERKPGERFTAARSHTASMSPDILIDMKKYAGNDLVIRAWADGSAGVAGYQEARETVLHLPK